MENEILFDKLYLEMSRNELDAYKPSELLEYQNGLPDRKAEVLRIFDLAIADTEAVLSRQEQQMNVTWRSVAHGNSLDFRSFRQKSVDRIADERFLAFLKAERKRVFE